MLGPKRAIRDGAQLATVVAALTLTGFLGFMIGLGVKASDEIKIAQPVFSGNTYYGEHGGRITFYCNPAPGPGEPDFHVRWEGGYAIDIEGVMNVNDDFTKSVRQHVPHFCTPPEKDDTYGGGDKK